MRSVPSHDRLRDHLRLLQPGRLHAPVRRQPGAPPAIDLCARGTPSTTAPPTPRRDYLQASLPLGGRVLQPAATSAAASPGTRARWPLQADWTVVMNNDVLVSPPAGSTAWSAPRQCPGRQGGLAGAGRRPARLRPRRLFRRCQPVQHAATWRCVGAPPRRLPVPCTAQCGTQVGYFRATPTLWGYRGQRRSSTPWKRRASRTAIVGSSWLHHYGSITISAMKQERGLSSKQGLSARDSYRLLGKSTVSRKWDKLLRQRQDRRWRQQELAHFGMTLHGERRDGRFVWR